MAVRTTPPCGKMDEKRRPHDLPALRKWSALGLGVLLIACFMFILGPALEQIPQFKGIVNVIDDRNIEAGMFFYTDVGLFSEARVNIKNSMDFPPEQR